MKSYSKNEIFIADPFEFPFFMSLVFASLDIIGLMYQTSCPEPRTWTLIKKKLRVVT